MRNILLTDVSLMKIYMYMNFLCTMAGDGVVSKDEFVTAFMGKFNATTAQAERLFPKLDKDGDGSVDLAEVGVLFKGMDKDGEYRAGVVREQGGTDASTGRSGKRTGQEVQKYQGWGYFQLM